MLHFLLVFYFEVFYSQHNVKENILLRRLKKQKQIEDIYYFYKCNWYVKPVFVNFFLQFFHIVTEAFKQATGSAKDLRKWGYEIFSTFIAPKAVSILEFCVCTIMCVPAYVQVYPLLYKNERV